MGKISERLKQFESSVMTNGGGLRSRASAAAPVARESSPMSMGKTACNAEELAVEHCEGCVCQMAKHLLFGLQEAQARRAQVKAAAVDATSSASSIASGPTTAMDV